MPKLLQLSTQFYLSTKFYPVILLIGVSAVLIPTTTQTKELPVVSQKCQDAKERHEQVTVKIEHGDVQGSGVIITKKESIYTVLTAAHVIEIDRGILSNDPLSIRTNLGRYQVTEVQTLRKTNRRYLDLALLKFTSPETHNTAIIGDSDKAEKTDKIFISGYPLSQAYKLVQKPELSTSFISSLYDNNSQGYDLRFSPPATFGMSGGAIFDVCGRVIGIHGQSDIRGISSDKTGENIEITDTFSAGIPINYFVKLLPQFELSQNQLAIDTSPIPDSLRQINNPFSQGIVSLDSQNYRKAIIEFTQVIAANPNNETAYFYRGISNSLVGNKREAIEDYTKAIEINPKLTNAYYYRGLILARDLRQYQEALSDFNRAIQLNPKLANVYADRGNIYNLQGDINKAIEDYTKAIKIKPWYAQAYYNRGVAYDKKGNPELALKDFKRAAELFSTQNDSNNYQRALDRIREIQGTY